MAGEGRAAEDTNSPNRKADLQELRERIKNLNPEERAVLLKELREKSTPSRDAVDRRREMLKKLSSEERELKLKQLRERAEAEHQLQERRKQILKEREARRMEVRRRLEQQLELLRKKAADGTISPEERVRLQRLERIDQRFGQREPLPTGVSPNPTNGTAEEHLVPNSPP